MTPLGVLADSAHTYRRRAPSLLLLAVVVFAPVALLDAIVVDFEARSLELDDGFELVAVLTAALALGLFGLLGEVFYTGAVAIALTRPHGERPASLREVAGMVAYRRLIVVDLIYGLVVAAGLLLLLAPGVVAFVLFGLAAPVVEIERRGVRAALARSVALVRGRFWAVLALLGPLQLLDGAVDGLAARLAHGALGDSLSAEWLSVFLSNLVVTPFIAVVVVLLTVALVAEKESGAPPLHSAAVHA